MKVDILEGTLTLFPESHIEENAIERMCVERMRAEEVGSEKNVIDLNIQFVLDQGRRVVDFTALKDA